MEHQHHILHATFKAETSSFLLHLLLSQQQYLCFCPTNSKKIYVNSLILSVFMYEMHFDIKDMNIRFFLVAYLGPKLQQEKSTIFQSMRKLPISSISPNIAFCLFCLRFWTNINSYVEEIIQKSQFLTKKDVTTNNSIKIFCVLLRRQGISLWGTIFLYITV